MVKGKTSKPGKPTVSEVRLMKQVAQYRPNKEDIFEEGDW